MSPRKLFIATLGLGLLAAPLAADAQQPGKVARIGILPPGPLAVRLHLWDAFRQGLRDLGYVEGQNIVLVFPSAEVRPERLTDLAAELVRLKVDVIVTAATVGTQAAQQATRTIPIVMAFITDPVETGLVTSLARPGGNITGLSFLSPELYGKRLQLLKEVVPGLSRTAVLSGPTNLDVANQVRELKTAAGALGVQLQILEVRSADDFEKAFQAATRGRAGALLTLDDSLTYSYRPRIVEFAAKHRLPAIYGVREVVDAGGLMSYGASLLDLYRRAATYVDKILKGAKPADLPVEQPTKFELVINLKTAKALGLSIPHSVLIRADQVIQ